MWIKAAYRTLFALTLCVPSTSLAQSRDRSLVVRGVIAAEDARFAAMVRADTAALRDALADDLSYIHSSGRVDTKQDYIASIASGALHYDEFSAKDRHVRVLDPTSVVVAGTAHTRVESNRQFLDADVRYTAVYERVNHRWRLVAWQTTRVP